MGLRETAWPSWKWIVAIAWVSLFALGLIDNSRGVVFPDLLREFSLSDTEGSFFFLVCSLATLVHNIWLYRFLSTTAPLRLIGIYTAIMGAGAVSIALAPTYMWTLASAVVLGFGFGGLGVGQNAAVQAAPKQIRQRALGLLHSMYGISSFLAPLLITYLAHVVSWRSAALLLSLPAMLICGVAWWVIANGCSQESPSQDLQNNRDMRLAQRPTAAFFLAATLVSLLVVAEISISSRLALLARREFGLSAVHAGHLVAAYFAAMTLSRLALGFFVGIRGWKPSAKTLLYISFGLGLPFLAIGFLPFAVFQDIRLMALAAFGFPIAMGYPLAMTRFAEVFGEKAQAVTSLCLVFQSGASVAMHFVLGW
ncbi:MAG: MFS transporter, partial [Bdellovibrionales bacterium]|nr:MFS transporter [Bdellovibrionales bacterium]